MRVITLVCVPDAMGTASPYFSADVIECEIDVGEVGRSNGDIWTLVRPRPGLTWGDVAYEEDVVLETEPGP
jgi:hypothetical protein